MDGTIRQLALDAGISLPHLELACGSVDQLVLDNSERAGDEGPVGAAAAGGLRLAGGRRPLGCEGDTSCPNGS